MMTDLRFAFRGLVKTPGFAFTALATLALCIGANLAIYAVLDAILLRSLPFADAGRLVTIYNSYPGAGVDRAAASLPNYLTGGRASRRSHRFRFSGGAASSSAERNPDQGADGPGSPEFFDTLGVRLAMGRSFTEDQMSYSNDGVAVLTDGFWRSHFPGIPTCSGARS